MLSFIYFGFSFLKFGENKIIYLQKDENLSVSVIGEIMKKHQSKIKELQPTTHENRPRSNTSTVENANDNTSKNRSSSFCK